MEFTVSFNKNGNVTYNNTTTEQPEINTENINQSDLGHSNNYNWFKKSELVDIINCIFLNKYKLNQFIHSGIAMFPLSPNSFTLSSEIIPDILSFIVKSIKEETDDRVDIENNCYLIHLIEVSMHTIKQLESQLINLTFDIYKLDNYQISLYDVLCKLYIIKKEINIYRNESIKRLENIIKNLEYSIPTNTLIFDKINYISEIYYIYVSILIDTLENKM